MGHWPHGLDIACQEPNDDGVYVFENHPWLAVNYGGVDPRYMVCLVCSLVRCCTCDLICCPVCWKEANVCHIASEAHRRNFENRVIYEPTVRTHEALVTYCDEQVRKITRGEELSYSRTLDNRDCCFCMIR